MKFTVQFLSALFSGVMLTIGTHFVVNHNAWLAGGLCLVSAGGLWLIAVKAKGWVI